MQSKMLHVCVHMSVCIRLCLFFARVAHMQKTNIGVCIQTCAHTHMHTCLQRLSVSFTQYSSCNILLCMERLLWCYRDLGIGIMLMCKHAICMYDECYVAYACSHRHVHIGPIRFRLSSQNFV